jgi:hypothetical protein
MHTTTVMKSVPVTMDMKITIIRSMIIRNMIIKSMIMVMQQSMQRRMRMHTLTAMRNVHLIMDMRTTIMQQQNMIHMIMGILILLPQKRNIQVMIMDMVTQQRWMWMNQSGKKEHVRVGQMPQQHHLVGLGILNHHWMLQSKYF